MSVANLKKKFIIALLLVFAFSSFYIPSVLAQDVAKLVSDRCTECHTDARWKGKKKTRKQWAADVNKMVMWGARLTDEESNLVVEYLTAMSDGSIKNPTTTTTAKKADPTTTTTVKNSQASTTTSTTVAAATTSTTVLGTSTSIITEQAHTGVEVIWYLLGGGMMIGSGMALRNKDKQLKK